MKSREFCYWLQGYFEIIGDRKDDLTFDHAQVLMIANHLHMVFKHEIDPSYKPTIIAPYNMELNDIHDGTKPTTNDTRIRC